MFTEVISKEGEPLRYNWQWRLRRVRQLPHWFLDWLLGEGSERGFTAMPPNDWQHIRFTLKEEHKTIEKVLFGEARRLEIDFRHELFAMFEDDASELVIGERWEEQGATHGDQVKLSLRTEHFRRLALWYLWRWAWGEWFGLRRRLFYWRLHRQVESYKHRLPKTENDAHTC